MTGLFRAPVSGDTKPFVRRNIVAASSTAYSGAPAVTVGGTTTSIAGSTVVPHDNAGFEYVGPGALATWSTAYTYGSGRFTVVEFWTDADQFDLRMIRYNTKFAVYVDGRLATTSINLDSTGQPVFVNVNFGSAGIRRIQLKGVNMPFGGINVPAGRSVWYEPATRRPALVVTGDSYTFGTGADITSNAWCQQLGNALGYVVAVDGIGSTGWNSTSSNVPATRVSSTTGANNMVRRVAGVSSPLAPGAHVVALGFNDAGGNMTTAAAAMSAFYDACTIKPVFVGPWTPLGGTPNLTTVENTISTFCSSAGATFIQISGMITAGNSATFNWGDNQHVNQLGHDYLGARIACKLADAGVL